MGTAGKTSRRFYLADLVVLVFLCGIIMAMFSSRRGIAETYGYATLLVFILVAWRLSSKKSWTRSCDKCGRPFYPTKPSSPLLDCPHCGARQAAVERSLQRRKVAFWALVPVLAIFGLVVMTLDAAKVGGPPEGRRLAVSLIAPAGALLTCLAMAWLAISRSRLARPRERACEVCKHLIPAEPPVASICPECQQRQASPEQVEKAQSSGIRVSLLTVVLVAILGGVGLVTFARSAWNSANLALLPVILLLALGCSFLAWKISQFLLRSNKLNALLTEQGALAKARECAQEEGTVVRNGSITIWYSGASDPVPMLLEERSSARRRFTAMLGETEIAEPQLRVLCFHNRAALANLFATSLPGMDLTAHLGIYFKRPWGLMTLCTATMPGRIDDPRTVASSLFCQLLMEQVYTALPAPWLDSGVAKSLGAQGCRGELLGLNRRMAAALAGGTAWSEDLFSATVSKISKLLLSKDPRIALKSDQFGDQSWSIVEYLCGEQAPDSRKLAFRAFLKDKQSNSRRTSHSYGISDLGSDRCSIPGGSGCSLRRRAWTSCHLPIFAMG